jgi:hypothetical protein
MRTAPAILLSSEVCPPSFFVLVTLHKTAQTTALCSPEPFYSSSYCHPSADGPLLPPSYSSTGQGEDKRDTALLSPVGRGIVALHDTPGGFVRRRGSPPRPSLRTRPHWGTVPCTAYAQGRACAALSCVDPSHARFPRGNTRCSSGDADQGDRPFHIGLRRTHTVRSTHQVVRAVGPSSCPATRSSRPPQGVLPSSGTAITARSACAPPRLVQAA